MIELTGITWNHTRGYLPMVATAQRFSELYPEVTITWHMRSLQAFADAPLSEFASQYDLMVIDHPSIGEAAHQDLLLPLEQHLPADFLADQAEHSVGCSYRSYHYNGHQYALAIDAATPISGWRPDLIERAEAELPSTWEDMLALARRGLVTLPAVPIDSLMNLFMLAIALGAEPFVHDDEVIAKTQGTQALQLLRELVSLSAPGSLSRNPIRTWQFLASSDRVAYCPFAYGYSNYSRAGYARNILGAGGVIRFDGKVLRSTLGGAGLAVSRSCRHPREALEYAQFTASPLIQQTLYTYAGGQPGHRTAWLDVRLNALATNFFTSTLPTLDAAWVRPRFPGYIKFQDMASQLVHGYLIEGGSEWHILDQINRTLHQTRKLDR